MIKFTILGCGSSMGVPRADGNWGKCDPNETKILEQDVLQLYRPKKEIF